MKVDPLKTISAIILCGVVVVTLFPFIHLIAISLSRDVYVLRGDVLLWPKGFTFKMYEYVLKQDNIKLAFKNSTFYVLLGTFISLLFTAMGGYALSRQEMIFRKFFTMLLVFALLFSGGMIPTFLVVKTLGMLNTIWAMIIPGAISIWSLIIMRTFFSEFPKEIEESGRLDGLNDIRIFIYLVLPLSKAVLATIGLFYAVGIWDDFFSALIYLREERLFPLQMVVYNIVISNMDPNANMNMLSSGGEKIVSEQLKYTTIVVATVPIVIVYPFLQKYFAKGALIGSLKG